MKRETNAGFVIIAAETYNTLPDGKEERIVLGKREGKYSTMYVTWESARHPAEAEIDYFWGHYLDGEQEARADYHKRLLEKYDTALHGAEN